MWIENYKGILEYREDEIKLQAKEGIVQILGMGLLIEYYSNEEMRIKGKITELHFL